MAPIKIVGFTEDTNSSSLLHCSQHPQHGILRQCDADTVEVSVDSKKDCSSVSGGRSGWSEPIIPHWSTTTKLALASSGERPRLTIAWNSTCNHHTHRFGAHLLAQCTFTHTNAHPGVHSAIATWVMPRPADPPPQTLTHQSAAANTTPQLSP